jgi:hypothetical protein
MGRKRRWFVLAWTIAVVAMMAGLFVLAESIEPISFDGDIGPVGFFIVGLSIWLLGFALIRLRRSRAWDHPGLRAGANRRRKPDCGGRA